MQLRSRCRSRFFSQSEPRAAFFRKAKRKSLVLGLGMHSVQFIKLNNIQKRILIINFFRAHKNKFYCLEPEPHGADGAAFLPGAEAGAGADSVRLEPESAKTLDLRSRSRLKSDGFATISLWKWPCKWAMGQSLWCQLTNKVARLFRALKCYDHRNGNGPISLLFEMGWQMGKSLWRHWTKQNTVSPQDQSDGSEKVGWPMGQYLWRQWSNQITVTPQDDSDCSDKAGPPWDKYPKMSTGSVHCTVQYVRGNNVYSQSNRKEDDIIGPRGGQNNKDDATTDSGLTCP